MPDDTRDIVDINKLPANSRRAREYDSEPKNNTKDIKKVISGKVVKKNKSFIDKFAETFFGDDAKTVAHYVIWDVMIPAAKNTISDMVQTGIDMLLFGESRGRKNRRDNDRSFVSYGSYYSKGGDRERRTYRSRSSHNFDDIILESRAEAEEVLSALIELVEQYDSATVADFYALCGEESEFTDDKYGWTSLLRSRIDRVRNGYVIVLPRPILLE